jgi:microcystin-dependent protein
MTATLRSPFNLSAHLRPTIGDQKMSYVGADHMGWVLCDGRAVSRVTYGLLFGVIGTTFGSGDGTSTFNLPNFSGMVPGMAGRRPDLTTSNNPTIYAIGDVAGEQIHKLNIDEMPSHTHGSNNVTGNNNGNGFTTLSGEHFHTGTTSNNVTQVVSDVGFANNGVGTLGSADVATSETNGTHSHAFTTSTELDHQHQIFNTGGSNYHNNMQPTLFAGNMFIYSGRNMDAYFPYTWVTAETNGGSNAAYNSNSPIVPGRVLIW